MHDDYQYRQRQVERDTANEFRAGEGRISGYCSLFLGVRRLLADAADRFNGEAIEHR